MKAFIPGGVEYDPAYRSWQAMKARCTQQTHQAFKRYGGRGIKICKRWLGPNGFKNFYRDMGPRPLGMTLDRFPDKDGDYKPSNCRWATWHEQEQNRRNAKVTADLVKAIRIRLASGESQGSIARDLKLTQGHISLIASGKRWSNVPM